MTTESQNTGSYCDLSGSTTGGASTSFQIGYDNDEDTHYTECGDCDDNNKFLYPGNSNPYCNCDDTDGKTQRSEICDGIDNDCDNQFDEGLSCVDKTYYCNEDEDDHHATTPYITCGGTDIACQNTYESQGCSIQPGDDCDDDNPNVNPDQKLSACPLPHSRVL